MKKYKVYLVGGAVRDALLGLPVHERDWVVVQGTPEDLLNEGYIPVGKDFPVFLHPQTKEEYALARTERKSGVGYKGFSVEFSDAVTLEEDLRRRDLTINAIAQDPSTGALIDPFHGQGDISARLLRHVSEAFVEDPVRLLRVARFYARFYSMGFTLAPETIALLKQMVLQGEINHIVPERLWQEVTKSLNTSNPTAFWRVLEETGAMKVLFPKVSVVINDKWDVLVTRLSSMPQRWGLLQALWGVGDAFNTLPVPTQYKRLAQKAQGLLSWMNEIDTWTPLSVMLTFKSLNVFRQGTLWEDWCAVMGVLCPDSTEKLMILFERVESVGKQSQDCEGLEGVALAHAIEANRLRVLGQHLL